MSPKRKQMTVAGLVLNDIRFIVYLLPKTHFISPFELMISFQNTGCAKIVC